MDNEKKSFKRKFNTALEPFKSMLIGKIESQSSNEWLMSVNRLRESTLSKPEQYLGQPLPTLSITHELVHMIFDEFLTESAERQKSK